MLEEQRTEALSAWDEEKSPEALERMIELGLWDEAETRLDDITQDTDEYKLAKAQLLFKQHQYDDAERVVDEVVESNPGSRKAQLLQSELDIQSWQLEEADQVATALLSENSRDAEAGLIRGRVALLKRNYEQALEWADKVQD